MFPTFKRYLAVAFVDAESVRPSQKDINDLIEAVDFAKLIAVALHEATSPGEEARIGFISSDKYWQVFLLGQQFQVARVSARPNGEDLGEFSEFCTRTSKLLKWAVNRFQRSPHRLGVLREGGLIQKAESDISSIARRLLTFPKTFENNFLNEWDWRASATIRRNIADLQEESNTIVTIKKVNATLSPESDPSTFDPSPFLPLPAKVSFLRADFDVNTRQDNTAARFQEKHIDAFFEGAIGWHRELEAEISDFIEGER